MCDIAVMSSVAIVQTAVLLLRIDDIVSGSKKGEAKGSSDAGAPAAMGE